jgi:hypothetical protein
LKSAEYRFRLPVIQVRPSQEQTKLKPLSEFPGPPQSRLAEGHRTATRSGLDGRENGSTLARPGSTNLMKRDLIKTDTLVRNDRQGDPFRARELAYGDRLYLR